MDDQANADYPQLLSLLQPYGQTQLLAHWERLDPLAREHLAAQIRAIDFELLVRERAALTPAGNVSNDRAAQATSPPAIRAGATDNRFTPAEARARGEAALTAGEIGMILVAGGQGTRLGFDQPKGLFPIGPLSQRTLFQVIVDQMLAVAARYGVRIPLFIMTSPATTHETRQYFAQHNYLGLAAEDLFFFEQGTLPAVDAQEWKVLLSGPAEIAAAPDGHGGMLAALAKHVGFETLRARGIQQLFYGQIDNPLLTVCDPTFLGYHLLAGSELTTQAVRKHDPGERVGLVVQVGDHVEILEYSDLSPADAARRAPDGTLDLWAGNTAVHALDVAFLERMSQHRDALPLHLARKKVPYINAAGELVEPAETNAIKFERFVFDLLPQAKNALVVEVDRAVAFAPVKNASGAASDTAESAQAAMIAQHTSWLKSAGATVSPGARIEIHPRWALDAEAVKARITPGQKIAEDTYFE